MTKAATLTLAGFLLARIAEDEGDARKAGSRKWGSINRGWDSSDQRDIAALGDGPTERLFPVSYDYDEHVARWGPARVLAECEARRRIIAEHSDQHGCVSWQSASAYPYVGCSVLRLLALPYADHPEYREDWRP